MTFSLADFIALSYLLPLGIFISLYAARSPWRENELGVALMFQKVGFLMIVVLIVLSVFLGRDYPFREEVRTVTYSVVGLALWVDVVNLVRYQYRARHLFNPAKKWHRFIFRDKKETPMSNAIAALFASIVRTLVPAIVGSVLGWLASTGLTVDPEFGGLLTAALSLAFTGLYYIGVRLLETYVTPKFGVLLGLAKTPDKYTVAPPSK